MKLTFCGACQMVTGSCYLLEHGNTKILIDCGMRQGEHFSDKGNYEPWPFNPKEIDYVLVTHAHIDHCGRIPKLVRDGFRGRIISTFATLDFVELMLTDSAHVIQQDAQTLQKEPLYTQADVEQAVRYFQGVAYHQGINLGDFHATWHDAGHILGSAFIEIKAGNKTIVFSGDLGNPPVPLLPPTEALPAADYLVMESTYGNQVHEASRERKLLLASAIYETITMKGVLIIPAFALERTQEILYELNELVEHKEIPPVPIFMDSPLAIKAMVLYHKYKNLFNAETKYIMNSGDDVFKFKGLKFTPTREESQHINTVKSPKIIMAGSGMMQGGRVRYHLQRYLSDYKSQVLIVGYQVVGSLGRQLLEKAKQVVIDNETIPVHAKIRAIGAYSAHADQPKLLHWLGTAPHVPSKIWLTHGEPDRANDLAKVIQQQFHSTVTVPAIGDVVEL